MNQMLIDSDRYTAQPSRAQKTVQIKSDKEKNKPSLCLLFTPLSLHPSLSRTFWVQRCICIKMASSTWWSVALGLSHWWTCEAGRWRRSGTAHRSRSHPPRAPSRSPCGPDGTEWSKNSQESHNFWGTCLWRLLTHWPTEELQPTMQLSSQECDRTRAPFSTVQRFILTPSSTTTPAPMVTFGPMVQFSPICAVGSYSGGRGRMECQKVQVSSRTWKTEEPNSPLERCQETRGLCAASRECVVVATEGTCTSLSGSLWADRYPSRNLQTDTQSGRQGVCRETQWKLVRTDSSTQIQGSLKNVSKNVRNHNSLTEVNPQSLLWASSYRYCTGIFVYITVQKEVYFSL